MDNKNEESFWQFSDQLRVQGSSLANLSLNNDYSIWSNSYSSKRPDQRRNFDVKGTNDDGWKMPINSNNNNSLGAKGIFSFVNNNNNHNYNYNYKSSSSGLKGEQGFQFQKKKQGAVDAIAEKKLKKTQLAASECLGRNERVGGYIFVCNNETMEENLQRKLFGLPPRYRDSVRSITPGMPLFLYNYSTHQLHGIFEAASFGGTNIDPTAWEDNKCPGESRFPAQVQVITRKVCEPLGEDSFRPILHHYDGPKFRLQLTLPEALSLLDIFADQNSFHHIFKAIPA